MTLPLDLFKCHEIILHPIPTGQSALAVQFLNDLPGVSALDIPPRHGLLVSYQLGEYTLCDLLTRLADAGFHIENGLFQKLHHALIFYSENVQLANQHIPALNCKSREAFSHIYDHHLHGDRDDTPEELRRYL